MKTARDIFVSSMVIAAKAKDKKAVIKLAQSGFNIAVSNSECLNIAVILGMEGDLETILFLEDMGIHFSKLNYMYGAALSGNDEFLMKLLNEKRLDGAVDYEILARGAARGGHLKLAERMIASCGAKNINYQHIANEAAMGGHMEIVEFYLWLIKKSLPNFNSLAGGAILGNHFEVAKAYLNRVEATKREYLKLAKYAVMKGQIELAIKLLKNADIKENTYLDLACSAARYGQVEAAEYFLCKTTKRYKEFFVALAAAAGGFKFEAEFNARVAIAKYGMSQVDVYQQLIENAAKNGHKYTAQYFLMKLPEEKRNDKKMAEFCRAHGLQAPVNHIEEKSYAAPKRKAEEDLNPRAQKKVREEIQETNGAKITFDKEISASGPLTRNINALRSLLEAKQYSSPDSKNEKADVIQADTVDAMDIDSHEKDKEPTVMFAQPRMAFDPNSKKSQRKPFSSAEKAEFEARIAKAKF